MSPKPSPSDSDFAPSQKEKNLSGVNEINLSIKNFTIPKLQDLDEFVFQDFKKGHKIAHYLVSYISLNDYVKLSDFIKLLKQKVDAIETLH